MTRHWKKILPIDRYTVKSNGLIHDYDRKVIILLYQPLIGPIAMSLYMSLWAQLEKNRLWSSSYSHHDLMSFMDLPLNVLYEARLKLEGIGLLKTYLDKDEDIRSFIYEIQPPLMPEQFFMDGMLNIYLFQKIGKKQYASIKQFFSDDPITVRGEYENVTMSFQEVYKSVEPSSFTLEQDEDSTKEYISRKEGEPIQIDENQFDFDLLFAGLSENLVPKKALNEKVRKAISNLAFLYGIDPIQMKNIVISAMDETTNTIRIDELRKNARDWYQFEHHDKLPQLVDNIQPIIHREVLSRPMTKEDKLIYYLENTSPRQLLIDISGGGKPSNSDIKIIEDILFNQKLQPGVVNVLIHFVLLKTDMKLTKNYVEKLASHWARKGVQTVREAMELAKTENRKYMEWAESKNAPRTTRKAPIRTELLPDWFENEDKQSDKSNKDIDEKKLADKKKQIEETLKKLNK